MKYHAMLLHTVKYQNNAINILKSSAFFLYRNFLMGLTVRATEQIIVVILSIADIPKKWIVFREFPYCLHKCIQKKKNPKKEKQTNAKKKNAVLS